MQADFSFTVQNREFHWSRVKLGDKLQDLARSTYGEAVKWSKEILSLPSNQYSEVQKQILDQLHPQILKSDDLHLVSLFKRAVRNHDTLFAKQSAKPVPSLEKHHESLKFRTPETFVTLDVREDEVIVTTTLKVVRSSDRAFLVLDGRDHDVKQVYVGDRLLSKAEYRVTPHELILTSTSEEKEFTVTIVSSINPYANDSMEGLYKTGNWLSTQCESEGARRIFYTIDRPDNLSKYTVKIIADTERFPTRLSNGNLIKEEETEDGRKCITWEDPFPKPSYLFATVLGDFDILEAVYQLGDGEEVKLYVYVEKGKGERARYSLKALEDSMWFDQHFFDRKYYLKNLKMVGVDEFNAGAMENTSLIIFNDRALLVDKESGADDNFRRVAHVVMHEYAHSWSGNRVTVASWHQLPLKEAFTEFRSMMFMAHFFSEEIARIDQIDSLRERQFPDDESPLAHPIHMDSYISPDDNYDATTYVKGSEVFRMLHTILGEKFRDAQNAYFERYTAQAATFRNLLSTLVEVSGTDLTVFERWFHQVGTPTVKVGLEYDAETKTAKLQVSQTCPHPKTKEEQEPFHIPLLLELIGKDGRVLVEKHKVDFTEREAVYTFEGVEEPPIPLFLHGLSAPVKWEYPFTNAELSAIVLHSTDAFWCYEASQVYAKRLLSSWVEKAGRHPEEKLELPDEVVEFYRRVLESEKLSPMAKAHALSFPSLRTIAGEVGNYDYQLIQKVVSSFKQQLAKNLELNLLAGLVEYPNPEVYDPYAKDFVEGMKIRAYRGRLYSYLLAANEAAYVPQLVDLYWKADNFHNKKLAVSLLANTCDPRKEAVLQDFYERWKGDKGMLNHWMTALTGSSECTIETLETVRKSEGYDPKNPNHIRSVLRVFANNPACFHDPEGNGYRYLTDKVMEVAAFNPYVANGYVAQEAYLDYKNLPEPQKSKMREQLERLRDTPEVPARIRETATNFLTEGAIS